jgi:hypothetical protein
MKLSKTIRRINLKSFWQLLLLGLKNPFFVYPTIVATKECIRISTEHYGRVHYLNTPANAFRHAFWNYLIAKKCTKWSKKIIKITIWAKDITDWHENVFKNREMARKMDFHNNQIGRTIFLKHQKSTIEGVIQLFLELTKKSIKITEQTLLEKHQFSLVHLTD